jgi:hypothetical protein
MYGWLPPNPAMSRGQSMLVPTLRALTIVAQSAIEIAT